MPDYSNPRTPLRAARYAWSVTLLRGPARPGSNEAKDITGNYSPPPGATVGILLDGIRTVYAREWGVPVSDVQLIRYSLKEK